MRIGVLRERADGELRVALTPEAVAKLAAKEIEVAVEHGAGTGAGFSDAEYQEAGGSLGSREEVVDGLAVLATVRRPHEDVLSGLQVGCVLIGFLDPLGDPDGVAELGARGIVAFAMESVPRITRAQSMDALSSQATVAGYKATLIAAERVPKLFPLMMTAAGTIAPARVLVLGAGVAGLQAIATARRLGAVVSAFDVRPAVAEQVESLGAAFLDLGVRGEETDGGYAKELTPEQQAAQQRALEERIPDFDVVITTAAIPGRPAPRLIPAGAVRAMRAGSCIVDLAAETGGNCELTVPGEERIVDGVTIVGTTNLPGTMAADASRLYARNVTALVELLAPNGALELDWDDEIVAGTCVARPAEAAA
jgi:NAD(P) transhydrogenase subunit alpha